MTEAPKPLTDEEVREWQYTVENGHHVTLRQMHRRLIATIDAKDQGLAAQRDLIEAEMNAAIAAEHRADAKDKELAVVKAEHRAAASIRVGLFNQIIDRDERIAALEKVVEAAKRVEAWHRTPNSTAGHALSVFNRLNEALSALTDTPEDKP